MSESNKEYRRNTMDYKKGDIISDFLAEITPQKAQELLDKNLANRVPTQRLIDRLARDMVDGNWQLTHQGIAINEMGQLLDGQNRMFAVVKSGATIKTRITTFYGYYKATDLVCDTGKIRTLSDITEYGKGITEVINYLFAELMGVGKPSQAEAVDLYEKLQPHFDFINNLGKKHRPRTGAASVRSAVFVAKVAGIDWSEEYRELNSDSMDKIGQDIFRIKTRLLRLKNMNYENRRYAFKLTMLAILKKDMHRVDDKQLDIAWEQAKEVMLPYFNKERK